MFTLSTKVFFVLALIIILWATGVQANNERSQNYDLCAPFDEWVGVPRFDYIIDPDGNWNLPPDIELVNSISFPVGGMWVYFSKKENARYIIIFRDFEPDGVTYGTHHICVYKN